MNAVDEEYSPPDDDARYVETVNRALRDGDSSGRHLRETLARDELTGLARVPNSIRGAIWNFLLLSTKGNRELFGSISDEQFRESANESFGIMEEVMRDQLEVDAKRTRPSLKRFRGQESKNDLVRILAAFCEKENLRYVQGINEIVAMFMLLQDLGHSPKIVCELLSSFLHDFASWDLESSDESDTSSLAFHKLKYCFRSFRILLQYHDSELFNRLESMGLEPNMYATSWFVTLFARNFSVEATFALWDNVIVGNDRSDFFFFATALLVSRRELLMQVNDAHLPEEILNLRAETKGEVSALWAWGMKLKQNTPNSFVDMLSSPLTMCGLQDVPDKDPVLMTVNVDDIFGDPNKQFLIWDCRTMREFESGRIARAAHLELDGLRFGSREDAVKDLESVIAKNEPLRISGTHVCLVGSGIPAEDAFDVIPAATCLTKNGFRYISFLKGGFPEALTKSPEQVTDLSHAKLEAGISLRKRQEERSLYARERGVPDGVIALVNRTDSEVTDMVDKAKGTIERFGSEIRSALANQIAQRNRKKGEEELQDDEETG
ncbi:hypothetical protein NDN08_003836 [Rhodosorus marinus]|uniref:TBC1 domain family member 23 n=1 Tax=Rhodosorus marinus TaxID=101924 RepID=A0AAV8UKL6_9RHOD|nr:hypothetical protein NDN08_003836 [Rhodosorus marinus]